jgi:hypothetical protein
MGIFLCLVVPSPCHLYDKSIFPGSKFTSRSLTPITTKTPSPLEQLQIGSFVAQTIGSFDAKTITGCVTKKVGRQRARG